MKGLIRWINGLSGFLKAWIARLKTWAVCLGNDQYKKSSLDTKKEPYPRHKLLKIDTRIAINNSIFNQLKGWISGSVTVYSLPIDEIRQKQSWYKWAFIIYSMKIWAWLSQKRRLTFQTKRILIMAIRGIKWGSGLTIYTPTMTSHVKRHSLTLARFDEIWLRMSEGTALAQRYPMISAHQMAKTT